MRLVIAIATLFGLAACGVDGPPVRPSVTSTVGTSANGNSASVTNDWISGNVSVHVGGSL